MHAARVPFSRLDRDRCCLSTAAAALLRRCLCSAASWFARNPHDARHACGGRLRPGPLFALHAVTRDLQLMYAATRMQQAHHHYGAQAKPPNSLGYSAAPIADVPIVHGHHDPSPAFASYGQPPRPANGKDPHAASAAAAAYASQSAQHPLPETRRVAADSPVSPVSPAMYSPQAPTPTHTPPLSSLGDQMEEVNEPVRTRAPVGDTDGRRAPVATSQTAPIMRGKHDGKHGGRPHKPYKQSTVKARKVALAAHGSAALPPSSGIAAMHDVPLAEEPQVAPGDVIALPVASHGTVDDEIQDKIIWLESQLDAFGSNGVISELFKLVSNARLTQGMSPTPPP